MSTSWNATGTGLEYASSRAGAVKRNQRDRKETEYALGGKPKQRHKNQKTNPLCRFQGRVALEAIKGIRTVQQIAAENELHPTQVTQWKTQMLEGAAEVFESGRGRKDQERTFQVREERLA